METLYFTLGIASVVVAAVAAGAVWAMLKVAKLNSVLRDVEQQFGSTHRDITMVEQTIMNNMDHRSNDIDKRIEDIYRTIDSRVDKTTDNLSREIAEIYRMLDQLKPDIK